MGPSIYDVHTEGGGVQAQVDACGRGEGGQASCVRPHRKLKLESTDVILSSSRAKKLASFFTRISLLDGIASEHFSATSTWGEGVRPMWTHVDRGGGSKTGFL